MTGFISVTETEIKTAIDAIPPSSAPGDDTFRTSVWKPLHSIRPDILTAMMDWPLSCRTLPFILKKVLAVIIPEPDKPDCSIPKAYRMIFLLPTLSKIIEHVVLNRLIDFTSQMTVTFPVWKQEGTVPTRCSSVS
ncbi:hypothetical protein L211DRAFT_654127 [Terfezia boudieri ATCC MYA-4762]|uniref:Reverse transcriptase domain-containing protein n=1 Tax=Terfezia boudieri ATCC MYA-4762 TaxID=1051890 RepID=A0A3N4M1I6_9PEZI|nr:hypothetical protein L211DRAFT_654127 [Terfezia boudieri ATCC MYA-4762]